MGPPRKIWPEVARPAGFEPATLGLEGRTSDRALCGADLRGPNQSSLTDHLGCPCRRFHFLIAPARANVDGRPPPVARHPKEEPSP